MKTSIPVILSSWATLNKSLHTVTESECKRLLDIEVANKQRMGIIVRLHSRYCHLRKVRELKDILGELSK